MYVLYVLLLTRGKAMATIEFLECVSIEVRKIIIIVQSNIGEN